MYWILFVMGVVAALVIAVVVGGLATPKAHVTSRTLMLRASPDTVWHTIRDVGSYAAWRPEIQSSEVDGEEWQESTSARAMRFGITHDEAPRKFAARILDDDSPFVGEWTWDVRPEEGGTRVTLTERGEVGNPVTRFIGAHMVGHTRSIDAFLTALAIRVGDAAARIEDARAESRHA